MIECTQIGCKTNSKFCYIVRHDSQFCLCPPHPSESLKIHARVHKLPSKLNTFILNYTIQSDIPTLNDFQIQICMLRSFLRCCKCVYAVGLFCDICTFLPYTFHHQYDQLNASPPFSQNAKVIRE